MSRLEIKVDGDDVSAEKMLETAKRTLSLLRTIEREIARKEGRKPSVRWRVDMQSGFGFGLIALRAEPGVGKDHKRERDIVWDSIQQRMATIKQQQATKDMAQ